MSKIARLIFRIFGWNILENYPDVKKCVVVMAPHTSNWDFLIGKLAFVQYRIPARFLIKKELFFFPMGFLLKAMGGIPVDRKKKNNMTSQASALFDSHEELFLVFTPEGTRSHSPHWKKGFYYIALEAKVPIYLGSIDYKKKVGGFDSIFHPTGDIEKDLLEIKRRLSKYQGKVAENGIRKEDLGED